MVGWLVHHLPLSIYNCINQTSKEKRCKVSSIPKKGAAKIRREAEGERERLFLSRRGRMMKKL
jgi:hypothetical protein